MELLGSKRPPWGAAPETPGEQGPGLQAQGLHRPSLPDTDGWVWPGVWFPCRGGCAGGVFSPLLGRIQGGPDTRPWTPGLPGDCPRASGPLCGLSAWPVTAQVIGYRPQSAASPWAQSACHFSFSEAASGTKLI